MTSSPYSADHPALPPVKVGWEGMADEVLEKAMENARAMLPRLTQLARTASETPDLAVLLRAGGSPQTDGVHMEIPILPAFAGMNPDDPCTCNQRFECAYCFIVSLILHESAHISLGSTKPLTPESYGEIDEAIACALAWTPEEFREWFQTEHATTLNLITAASDWDPEAEVCSTPIDPERFMEQTNHPFLLGDNFNPAVPLIINALEDARINRVMGERRTALPKPLARYVSESVLDTGRGEGWAQAPISYQVAASIATRVEYEFDMSGLLKSEAVSNVLGDEIVKSLTELTYKSVNEVTGYMIVLVEYIYHTYGVFPRQRGLHGYSETEPIQSARASGPLKTGRDTVPGTSKLKPSQQKRELHALEQQSSDTRNEVRAQQNAAALTPEERARRIPQSSQAPLSRRQPAPPRSEGSTIEGDLAAGSGDLGLVMSGEGAYPVLLIRPNFGEYETGQWDDLRAGITYGVYSPHRGGYGEDTLARADRLIGTNLIGADTALEMRRAFGMNRRSANVPNLERGRLHGVKLARAQVGNRRVFRRIDKARKRSYKVLIGIDLSGSTSARYGAGSINERLVELAYHQAELLHQARIPFAILGHSGESRSSSKLHDLTESDWDTLAAQPDMRVDRRSVSISNTCDLYLAKGFEEKWDTKAKHALFGLHVSHQNLDGQTMRAYIRMLASQRATDRILLYYTDGAMPAEDSARQQPILKRECSKANAWAKRQHDRLRVIGIAYGCDDPKKYGLDTIEVDSGLGVKEQVRLVVDGLAERIIEGITK